MRTRSSPSPARWRAWLAVYLFVAVAWPAAGPLPWLLLDGDHTAANALEHGPDAPAIDGRHDTADVPGSPTHPLNHDCAQCEVLKHLARCVFPGAFATSVALPPGEPVLSFVEAEPRHASFIAARPPIRGPPAAFV